MTWATWARGGEGFTLSRIRPRSSVRLTGPSIQTGTGSICGTRSPMILGSSSRGSCAARVTRWCFAISSSANSAPIPSPRPSSSCPNSTRIGASIFWHMPRSTSSSARSSDCRMSVCEACGSKSESRRFTTKAIVHWLICGTAMHWLGAPTTRPSAAIPTINWCHLIWSADGSMSHPDWAPGPPTTATQKG